MSVPPEVEFLISIIAIEIPDNTPQITEASILSPVYDGIKDNASIEAERKSVTKNDFAINLPPILKNAIINNGTLRTKDASPMGIKGKR